MDKILILAFYGCGKTTIKNERMADLTDEGLPSLSLFEKFYDDDKYQVIMADPQWEKVFVESGHEFYIVIPTDDRKEEFIQNYRDRWEKGTGGGDDRFCTIIETNWDNWLKYYYRFPLPRVKDIIELEKGEFLNDFIKTLGL